MVGVIVDQLFIPNDGQTFDRTTLINCPGKVQIGGASDNVIMALIDGDNIHKGFNTK